MSDAKKCTVIEVVRRTAAEYALAACGACETKCDGNCERSRARLEIQMAFEIGARVAAIAGGLRGDAPADPMCAESFGGLPAVERFGELGWWFTEQLNRVPS